MKKYSDFLEELLECLGKDDCECDCEAAEDDDSDAVDVELDEETGEYFFTELCEETLVERRIKIRITSRGERIKRIKCPPGRIAKSVNGRRMCVTPTGRQKLVKRLATRKTVRTKRAKGSGFVRRTNFKRQRAIRRRKQMGLRDGQ